MYKYVLINVTILILTISLTSCSSKKDIVMAEFDGGKITLAEYEEVYAKNNGGYDLAKKDSLQKKKTFLDLYVNFKMKIKDAKERNIDQQPAVQAEIIDYKNKIGVSYLLEKELVEPNIKQLY
ncbi:MAG: hypothetical protein N3A61_08775, partial [Ignavibacteria bacterium]|nr:hypothetical protein [Ignavibacteria bacterium]